MKNIPYQTGQIANYFAHNRIAWTQFYESERVIIDRLGLDRSQRILDIGCGCGGLGLALREQFGIENYTGVEINPSAAAAGREMNLQARILCGDILDLTREALCDEQFDVVFSLSCVDWNVCFADMLAAAWNHVLPGGHLVATFRLTTGEGCGDPAQSYQFINYDGVKEGERAAYVVLNARDLLAQLTAFAPAEIRAFGYWGAPSVTAVTPYERLCFAAFSTRKNAPGEAATPLRTLDLPADILATLNSSRG